MRARTRIRRLGALVALITLVTLGVSAFPHLAGAQEDSLPNGDDRPSCSLFPTRLGVGQWFFTNRRDFTITLQIAREDGEIVFDGTLDGGESTPIFALTRDTVIHWAGGTYHLTAYDLVNCLAEEGELPTTTTTETPTTSTTPSTVPVDSTTTPAAPTTTAAPAPATASTEPPPCPGAAAADVIDRCRGVESVAVEAVVAARNDTVAVVVARTAPRDDLPTTGFPVGLVALGGVGAALTGLTCLAIAHRRQAEA